MVEWIGHFIANWPLWAIILTLIVVGVIAFMYNLASVGADVPWKKKEWWQDRHKRLEREAKARQVKMKAKKG